MRQEKSPPRFAEFVALMATLTSLVALTIDAMLPALGDIGRDLGVTRENEVQLVVSLVFLGVALGQLAYGPLADSTGRKPALLIGLGIFMLGSVLSTFAATFSMMLAGRLLQGLGVAGPRIVTLAIIRDQYQGRRMAQVMSFVMAVFIIVPLVAPMMGQAILQVASWRAIFGAFLGIAAGVSLWFVYRQQETLPRERRIPISLARTAGGFREVLSTRTAIGYTVTAGLVFSPFVAYLSTAQQLFQVRYGLGRLFPLYFALLSLALGAAALSNSKLVMRFGMSRLVHWALSGSVVSSALFFLVSVRASGLPSLSALVSYLLVVFFCQGILYGNMNALAMEPLGHIAGIGAAVVGAVSLALAIVGGTIIGQAYSGTVLPLVGGFGLCAAAALAVVKWTEAARPQPGSEPAETDADS